MTIDDDGALRDVDGKLLVDSQGKKLVKSRRLVDGQAFYDTKVEVSLREWVEQLPVGHRARCEYEQLVAAIELQSLVLGRMKAAR